MFQTTRWSLVFRAGAPGDPGRSALAELCAAYWPPVHAFYRRAARPGEDAEDLVQGLFARLLARDDFAAAAPERGRFRHWLCACARHHLADVRAAAVAHKRGGGVVPFPLAFAAEDEAERREPVDPLATPEQAFARRWVRALIDRALARLAAEPQQDGRGRLFAFARSCLDGEPAEPYAVLAARLGTSEGAFKVAVHRLRERLRELVRAEVRDTLVDVSAADDELAFLLGELARKNPPGR